MLEDITEKNKKLEQYYKPSHKKKLDINRYIKTCLGVLGTKENAGKVKEILLSTLGYEIYDEVPIDILHSKETYNKILEICKLIASTEGQIQVSLLD